MSQNVTVQGATYSDVPGIELPKQGGGTAYFADVSDTTAAASDVASGKYFYNASGVKTAGTSSGGGGGGGDDDVIYIDYDGTVLHQYSKAEFLALSAHPANPTHAGLTSQGWNWSLADAQAYVTLYESLIIGQQYVTDDGNTRVYFTIPADTPADRMVMGLYFQQSVANGVEINWGDGSTPETFTGTSAQYKDHTYANAGDYVMSVKVTSGNIKFGYNYTGATLVSNNNATRYRASWVNKIEFGSDISAYKGRVCYEMSNLETVTIPISTATMDDGYHFGYCNKLKTVIYPDGLATINSYECGYSNNIQYIAIPKSVTKINDNAFYMMNGLKKICCPPNISSLGNYAFGTLEKAIVIIAGEPTLGTGVYSGSYGTKGDIVIPGTNAAVSCSNTGAKKITIKSGVTTLTSIQGNKELEVLSVPNTITSYGNYTYADLTKIESLTISTNPTTLASAFAQRDYALKEITIPGNITTINQQAFYDCWSLRKVTLNTGLTTLMTEVFARCYNLMSITIPSTVTAIGNSTFRYCYALKEVHMLPNSPPTLGGTYVFNDTSSDLVIYVPAESLNDYKTATNWSTHASKMVGE